MQGAGEGGGVHFIFETNEIVVKFEASCFHLVQFDDVFRLLTG